MGKHVAFFAFLIMSICFLSGCAQLITPRVETALVELRTGEYRLDPEHAALLFKVDHMGLSSFVGRFEKFDASLDFVPEQLADSRLDAVIDMASINVNSTEFADTLRGSDWFAVQTYPQAHFSTTSVASVEGNIVKFNGVLEFLGVKKPVMIDVNFRGGATNMLTAKYTIGFSAIAQFKRSEFGMDKYIPAVGDDVTIEVYAEFQRN
ncbi:YceI family protein [Teredinibacter turnerae]|uniref:YceI family protein n=1 Tax=Teredinibacter turnerae TaxID=2426 RepID=UPI0030D07696